MTIDQNDERTPRKPLRLWPGVVAVALQWLGILALPSFLPETQIYGMIGGVFAGLVVLVWWLFFSRAAWSDRLGVVVLMAGALFVTSRLVHESIANGLMGMLFPILAIPVLSLALVVSVAAGRGLSSGPRRAWLVAGILLACGAFTLVRTGGISGDADSDLHWRWTPTPEERLLARAGQGPTVLAPAPAAQALAPAPPERAGEAPAPPAAPSLKAERRGEVQVDAEPAADFLPPTPATTRPEWPGFRGPGRDGIVRGVRIQTDWAQSPPVELWRRPIGPGWSSFAIQGDLLYTQEQRGDDEIVGCYRLSTGEPVWRHRDAARFWESNGGPGPRATPTLSEGRLYAFGATGILNALDARDGSVVWSRNAALDTGTEVPGWGFAGSPLVFEDMVIVATSGQLAAYDRASGEPRWFGPTAGGGYSSPHLVTIDDVSQILLLNGRGATSVAPADGQPLWEHPLPSGTRIVQPALTADGDLLINLGDYGAGNGMRRIALAHGPDGWTARERWTSMGLKPNFNDFVVHAGHAFGFDGSILACIDLRDGTRRWKGGRFGHGQLVLLPDQDVLLVLSEQGELALVRAAADQFTELARFPALEGKTWNHPALVGDVLLVRNGQEMAAFRLPLAGD